MCLYNLLGITNKRREKEHLMMAAGLAAVVSAAVTAAVFLCFNRWGRFFEETEKAPEMPDDTDSQITGQPDITGSDML